LNVQWSIYKVRINFIYLLYYKRIYNINTISPLVTKKNQGTLTIEEILDNIDAISDLKLNPGSQLQDL